MRPYSKTIIANDAGLASANSDVMPRQFSFLFRPQFATTFAFLLCTARLGIAFDTTQTTSGARQCVQIPDYVEAAFKECDGPDTTRDQVHRELYL